MSLIDSAKAEFKRSPITVTSGAVGVLVAAMSLILAAVKHEPIPEAIGQAAAEVTTSALDVNVGNILVVVSYFLSSAIVSALIIRRVARKHDVVALFASVPLAALVNFSVILLLYLAPPRMATQQLFLSAHDLVLYASAAIYVSVCGVAVLRDLASPALSKNKEKESNGEGSGDGVVLLVLPVILLLIWCWLVFAGQTRITQTFLPEVTHYTDNVRDGT